MLQKLKITSHAFIFMLIAFGFTYTAEGAQYIPDDETCTEVARNRGGTAYEKKLCKCFANTAISKFKQCEKKAKKFAKRNSDEFTKDGRLKRSRTRGEEIDPCSAAGVSAVQDALLTDVLAASLNIGQEAPYASSLCESRAQGKAGGSDAP